MPDTVYAITIDKEINPEIAFVGWDHDSDYYAVKESESLETDGDWSFYVDLNDKSVSVYVEEDFDCICEEKESAQNEFDEELYIVKLVLDKDDGRYYPVEILKS